MRTGSRNTKLQFGQRHAITTADGIRYWIEGRRVFDGKRSYKFTSVVIWQHPTKTNGTVFTQGGYWNVVRFDKSRPSAKEIEQVVIDARFNLLSLGDQFRGCTGGILTVVEIDQATSTVKAFMNEGDDTRKVYTIPASAIWQVL